MGDVYIYPTTREGIGLTITEALATGIPTIVSRFAGAAELITHKLNGILLENPGNPKEIASHINKLNNDSFREAIGRQGRRLAERFPVKKNTEKILRLYKNLLYPS